MVQPRISQLWYHCHSGWVTLLGGCPVCQRMFSSISGLFAFGTRSAPLPQLWQPKMSLDIGKHPWDGRVAPGREPRVLFPPYFSNWKSRIGRGKDAALGPMIPWGPPWTSPWVSGIVVWVWRTVPPNGLFFWMVLLSLDVPALTTASCPFCFDVISSCSWGLPGRTKRFAKFNSKPTEDQVSGKSLNRMRAEAFHFCLPSSPAESQAQCR